MYYFLAPMIEDDIEEVQQVERESCNLLWSPTTYRRELRQQDRNRYMVARASQRPLAPDEQPPRSSRREGMFNALLAPLLSPEMLAPAYPLVGYAGVWVLLDEGHITTIAVAPAHRRQGVGELLLNGLIDHAIELGAESLTLEVRLSNTAAQRLYLKYGFHPAGKRPRYYTDNSEDALIMWADMLSSADYQARLRTLRQQLAMRLHSSLSAATEGPSSRDDEQSTAAWTG